jgi:hypothetical protein
MVRSSYHNGVLVLVNPFSEVIDYFVIHDNFVKVPHRVVGVRRVIDSLQ